MLGIFWVAPLSPGSVVPCCHSRFAEELRRRRVCWQPRAEHTHCVEVSCIHSSSCVAGSHEVS